MRIASWIVAVLTVCLLVTTPARATTGSEDSAAVLHLRYLTVVGKDYDAALAWYTNVLGLRKFEDRTFGPGASLAGSRAGRAIRARHCAQLG